MPFVDKWGTSYPDSILEHVLPGDIVDTSPEIKQLGDYLTRDARSSDEAIMKIHEFMKTGIKIGHVPLTLDVPVRKASDQLKSCRLEPGKRNLCHQKAILEVALQRSQGIPSRIGVALCGLHGSRTRLSPLLNTIADAAPLLTSIPSFPHTYPEVYSFKDGKGGFRRKDAWIDEAHCKKFKGSCLAQQEKQWEKDRDVKDVQAVLNCVKIQDSKDFPEWLAFAINAGVTARESSHLIDIIDPVPGED